MIYICYKKDSDQPVRFSQGFRVGNLAGLIWKNNKNK